MVHGARECRAESAGSPVEPRRGDAPGADRRRHGRGGLPPARTALARAAGGRTRDGRPTRLGSARARAPSTPRELGARDGAPFSANSPGAPGAERVHHLVRVHLRPVCGNRSRRFLSGARPSGRPGSASPRERTPRGRDGPLVRAGPPETRGRDGAPAPGPGSPRPRTGRSGRQAPRDRAAARSASSAAYGRLGGRPPATVRGGDSPTRPAAASHATGRREPRLVARPRGPGHPLSRVHPPSPPARDLSKPAGRR